VDTVTSRISPSFLFLPPPPSSCYSDPRSNSGQRPLLMRRMYSTLAIDGRLIGQDGSSPPSLFFLSLFFPLSLSAFLEAASSVGSSTPGQIK